LKLKLGTFEIVVGFVVIDTPFNGQTSTAKRLVVVVCDDTKINKE